MSKPVQVVKYPPPDKLNQYVRNPSPAYPTPKVGNWLIQRVDNPATPSV